MAAMTAVDSPSRSGPSAIVAFQPAHLSEIADLWVAAWTLTMPSIDFEARRGWLIDHLQGLAARGVRIEVALVATGAVAGFVTVDPSIGHLDQICVGPDWHGHGIAEALLQAARQISPSGLRLDVNADNPRAVRFYHRNGFVETGRGSNPRSGLPILMMQWLPEGEIGRSG